MLSAFFLAYRCQKCQTRFVYLGQIHGHVLFGKGPLEGGQCLPGEHRLVQVDDPVPISLGLGQLPFHLSQLSRGLCLVLVLRLLKPFDSLLLNLFLSINLSK